MSDTAPLRRPVRRRERSVIESASTSSGIGALFTGLSRYGVNKMTTNIHAGDMRKRISVMFGITLVALFVVFARVVTLQTWRAPVYQSYSEAQRTRDNVIPAERGSILDRDGNELAIAIPTRTIFADPREVTDPVTTGRALATVLQLTPEEEFDLVRRMQDKTSAFAYVVRQVDSSISQAVADLNLPGIGSYREYGRALTRDRKSTRLNSSHTDISRMPSSA